MKSERQYLRKFDWVLWIKTLWCEMRITKLWGVVKLRFCDGLLIAVQIVWNYMVFLWLHVPIAFQWIPDKNRVERINKILMGKLCVYVFILVYLQRIKGRQSNSTNAPSKEMNKKRVTVFQVFCVCIQN